MSDVSAFAPGRVELLGNHTDYNEGLVLSTAIQFGITVVGRSRDDTKIICTSEEASHKIVVDRKEGLIRQGSWIDYPLGVAEMLARAGAVAGGFEAHYSSTLPMGAGLSSSAALEVATAILLLNLYPFEISSLDLAKLCRRAENEFVGAGCGLLDQVSSIFGKKNHIIYLDFRSEKIETIPFPANLGLLVVHSGVQHSLVSGEYDQRRKQCLEAAKRMGVPALRDVTSSQLIQADLPDLIRRRATHIVGENERVLRALECLREGNGEELGRLMIASHDSSKENFENSAPELDELVSIAVSSPGCYGARLTGGGFGGAIVVLSDLERLGAVGDMITNSYKKNTGKTAVAYRCMPSEGAFLIG